MFKRIFKIKFTTFLFFVTTIFVTVMLIIAIPKTNDPLTKALDAFSNTKGSINSLSVVQENEKNFSPNTRYDINFCSSAYSFRIDGLDVKLVYFESIADYEEAIAANTIRVSDLLPSMQGCLCYLDILVGGCDEKCGGTCQGECMCHYTNKISGVTFAQLPMKEGAGGVLVLITKSEKALEIFKQIRI